MKRELWILLGTEGKNPLKSGEKREGGAKVTAGKRFCKVAAESL